MFRYNLGYTKVYLMAGEPLPRQKVFVVYLQALDQLLLATRFKVQENMDFMKFSNTSIPI